MAEDRVSGGPGSGIAAQIVDPAVKGKSDSRIIRFMIARHSPCERFKGGLLLASPEKTRDTSPVPGAKLAENGHLSRISRKAVGQFLCSSDLLGSECDSNLLQVVSAGLGVT